MTLTPINSTKALLVVTAAIELATGFLLFVEPSLVSKLLLGKELGSPEASLVGQIAGAALLSIGLNCWLGRNNGQAFGLVAGLLVYNAAVGALLLYGAVIDKMHGIGIWPAIGLHSVLLIWCALRLRHFP